METLTGTISGIEYHNPASQLHILRINADGTPVRAVGFVDKLDVHSTATARGKWRTDIRGRLLEFSELECRPPTDPYVLPRYLQEKTGLPLDRCKEVSDFFGCDLFVIIDSAPERLNDIGLTKREQESLIKAMNLSDRVAALHDQLSLAGIDQEHLQQLAARLGTGNDLAARVRANPYLLYAYIDDLPYTAVHALAARYHCAIDGPNAIAAALLASTRRAFLVSGDTCFPVDDATQSAAYLLGITLDDSSVRDALQTLEFDVLWREGPWLKLPIAEDVDRKLIHHLKRIVKNESPQHLALSKSHLSPALQEAPYLDDCIEALQVNFSLIECEHLNDQYKFLRTLKTVLFDCHADVLIACPFDQQLPPLSELADEGVEVNTLHGVLGLHKNGPPDKNTKSKLDIEVLVICHFGGVSSERFQQILAATPSETVVIALWQKNHSLSIDAGNLCHDLTELFPLKKLKTQQPSPWFLRDEFNKDSIATLMRCSDSEIYENATALRTALIQHTGCTAEHVCFVCGPDTYAIEYVSTLNENSPPLFRMHSKRDAHVAPFGTLASDKNSNDDLWKPARVLHDKYLTESMAPVIIYLQPSTAKATLTESMIKKIANSARRYAVILGDIPEALAGCIDAKPRHSNLIELYLEGEDVDANTSEETS